jgi:hypothetical protein
MSKANNQSQMTNYINIFIMRLLIYTVVCFGFIFGLSKLEVNLSSGFYFFPFVMTLLILEHLAKTHSFKSKQLITFPIIVFLLIYYLAYSVLFLLLTGHNYEMSSLINIIIGHFIHFFGAVLLSMFYAKIRARKSKKITNKK